MKINYSFYAKTLGWCVLFWIVSSLGAGRVLAQSCEPIAGCQNTRVDLRCQADKVLDPNRNCELCYCGDNQAQLPNSPDRIIDFNLFGIGFKLNSDQAIAQLVYLLFTFFLGVVAIVTVALGVYASVLRASDEQANQEKSIKIMRNAILGFVLVGMSLLIVQVVASFLGVGNLFSIVTFDNLIPSNDF